jgi:hypothetical protein
MLLQNNPGCLLQTDKKIKKKNNPFLDPPIKAGKESY